MKKIKSGIVCEECGYDDAREFKELNRFITYVCPKCSNMWTVEIKEKKEVKL